jgi:hypothetical protein
MPNEYGNFSPYQLARVLAVGNNREPDGTRLVRVEVHRGLPDSTRDPTGYGANRRQSAAWMKEDPEVVIPRLRPLRDSRDEHEPPVEKGVDVQLALAAVEHTITGFCDVAIIFSHDTDLVPALETIVRLKGTQHIETAAWSSENFWTRLRVKGTASVFHHSITEDVFKRVATPVNYARSS